MGQFWTLPIEICFYAIVGAMVVAKVERRMMTLAWVVACASAIYFVCIEALGGHDPAGRISALLLLQHGGFFALGIMLSDADKRGYNVQHGALALLCVVLAAVQIRDAANGEKLIDGISAFWFIPFAIWMASVALLAASLRWKVEIADRFQAHGGTVRLIGLVTFPLYLIHIHAGGPIFVALARSGASPIATLAAGIIVSLLVSVAIVRFIEPLLHARMASLFDRAVGSRRDKAKAHTS